VVVTLGKEAPLAFFGRIQQEFQRNNLPKTERVPPPDFCTMIEVDKALVGCVQNGGLGKGGYPLRTFYLIAVKGQRQVVVSVSRTTSGAQASPDGEALARGVMRSLRLH
jgi:hypothetical protein